MKIEFNAVTIQNFMSIGNAEISLTDLGYTMVSGVNNNPQDLARSNGSGKSSIFEAIVWCLTGETMRGNKDIVNFYSDDGALVSIKFSLDGQTYIITRTKEHSHYKTNLLINVDGVDKSGKGIRDSEKLLKEYLPDLTASLIGSVIILGQGLPTRFSNNSPSGRKEVLEKLCKSDFMIEDLKQRISSRKSFLQQSLREYEDAVLEDRTRLRMNEDTLAKEETSLQSLLNGPDYDTLIAELGGLIGENQSRLDLITLQCEKLTGQIEELRKQQLGSSLEKENELLSVNAEYEPLQKSLTDVVQDLQGQLKVAKNELNILLRIKDVCPTCGQRLPEVHRPDTAPIQELISNLEAQLSEVSQQLDNLNSNLDQARNEVADKYRERERRLAEELMTLQSSLFDANHKKETLVKNLSEQQQELIGHKTNKDNLIQNIENCKQRINELRTAITSLNDDILYYTNIIESTEARIQVIQKFNTVVTRDFRGYLLQSVIEYINLKAKEYSSYIFETDLIDFSLEGNNIRISYNNKQYEALSGGERQKVDLIIQFSIRDMLCNYTDFSTNILALDEIFDNLDDIGSQKIIDLISKRLCDISSVFIISHHGNELGIPCDNEIVIVKDSNGVSSIK